MKSLPKAAVATKKRNVVDFNKQHNIGRQEAIDLLEAALRDAKLGKIVGLTMLVEYSNDSWACWHTQPANVIATLGRLDLAAHTIRRACDE